MQLNSLELTSYSEVRNEVSFAFPGTVSPSSVMALDGQTLTITSQDKDYKTFAGYSLMSVGYADQSKQSVRARFFRALTPETDKAITGLDANVTALDKNVSDLGQRTGTVESALATLAGISETTGTEE